MFDLKDTNGVLVIPRSVKSVESQFPAQIPEYKFPKWPDGGFKAHFGFFSNSPPVYLNEIALGQIYQIKVAGDYTFTVCPIIYKHEINAPYFDRVNLPCVTTKIHLLPNQ